MSRVSGRVLILSTEFPPGPGGIGAHAYQLAQHLARRGWRVHVAAPQPYVSAADQIAFNVRQNFQMTTLEERDGGRWWWLKRWQRINRLVAEMQPDVVVASGSRALWMAALLTLRFKAPWLAVGHGTEFLARSPLVRWLNRWAIRRATAVVAVSDYTAGLVRELAAPEPQRMRVILNAADGERFHTGLDTADLRAQLGLGNCRVLLTVGNVSERKAQDVVIRALPDILRRFPDLVYLIAGLPTRRAEFEQLAQQLDVADHVRFLGMVEEGMLPRLYNLADLFVLVSRQAADGDVEGYGIVVQEAALCGLAAIVSKDCGLEEAIIDGVTGVAVPPDDPGATAAAILFLLGDETRRTQMGERAQEVAREATWEQRIAAYDQLLRELTVPRFSQIAGKNLAGIELTGRERSSDSPESLYKERVEAEV